MGIAVVTSGPAITNTLTAVADANADSIPLLVFAGQVAQTKMGTDEFQTINVASIFADAAKKVILLPNCRMSRRLSRMPITWQNLGNPDLLSLTFLLISRKQKVSTGALSRNGFATNTTKSGTSEKTSAASFLIFCRKPSGRFSICGGLNSAEGSERIRAFNRRYRVPSIWSLMGKGILNEEGDWALGMLGMFGVPAANMAIQETDLFVAFGIRWDDRVSQKVGESGLAADIAYFDINPEKVQEVRFSRNPKFSLSVKPKRPLMIS